MELALFFWVADMVDRIHSLVSGIHFVAAALLVLSAGWWAMANLFMNAEEFFDYPQRDRYRRLMTNPLTFAAELKPFNDVIELNRTRPKKVLYVTISIFVFLSVIKILVPSNEKQVYIIAGAYVAQNVVETAVKSDTADKIKQVINKKLDEYLAGEIEAKEQPKEKK